PFAEPSSPATRTNFLELRSQNPVASDVAAVDEPGYTQTNPTRQHRFSKKIKKSEKTFIKRKKS
ncbi:MAG: hypothetical protein RID22_06375, partial [Roseibium aggregatum]